MITKNIPTYHCSYCNRYYIHKGNASRHEKFCKNNPNNKHACFHLCRHLIREKQDTEYTEYMVRPPQKTVFTCAITKQKMYSFIAEKKNLPNKYRLVPNLAITISISTCQIPAWSHSSNKYRKNALYSRGSDFIKVFFHLSVSVYLFAIVLSLCLCV